MGSHLAGITGPTTGATGPTGPTGTEAAYNAAGTQQTGSHIVRGTVAYSGNPGTATVTLTSPASYTSASSYSCTASETITSEHGQGFPFNVKYTSGTQFSLVLGTTGNKSGEVSFICVGN